MTKTENISMTLVETFPIYGQRSMSKDLPSCDGIYKSKCCVQVTSMTPFT